MVQKYALGIGYLATYLGLNGLAALALPYYQMHQGVDPFLLGALLSLPVFIGAVGAKLITRGITFFIAQLSSQRFVFYLGWLTGLVFLLLWLVPQHWSPLLRAVGLTSLFLLYSIFINALIILFKMLAFNLAKQQHDHGVFNITTFAEKVGAILYFWLFPMAALPFWNNIDQGVVSVASVLGLGLIGGAASLISVLFDKLAVEHQSVGLITDQGLSTEDFIDGDRGRMIGLLLLVVWLQFGAIGLCVSFDYYLLVYYVEQGDISSGSNLKGVLSTAYAVAGILYIPLLNRLHRRFNLVESLQITLVLASLGAVLKWYPLCI